MNKAMPTSLLFSLTIMGTHATLSITTLHHPVHSTRVILSSGKIVNMVLCVHRNHKVYLGRGEGGMEVREEGAYIPIATLSPPE